jgi:hypothetical protein
MRPGGRLPAALLAAGVLLSIVVVALGTRPAVVEAGPGEAPAIVRSAPEGTTLRLLPGTHGPFDVDRRLEIVGSPGAVVRGPLRILADDVRVADLRVEGGIDGIEVRDVEGVVLERVHVTGARYNGIEVAAASVTVRDCVLESRPDRYTHGFSIRNSNHLPRSVVEGCTVTGGQEGLVSHVARVEFLDNHVTDTTMRAITVTEMSEGLIEGNRVEGLVGAGLFCGDMSHCEIRGNVVRDVAADPSGVRSAGGYGVVGLYYSTLRIRDNTYQGLAAGEPVRLAIGTIETDRFPMSYWPPGWRGALSSLGVAVAALASFFLVRLAVGPWVRRRQRAAPPSDGRRPELSTVALGVLTAGFVAQSFHMLEHGVQIYQVYVAHAEIRSGVLGTRVDMEWVHFAYNAGVLAFLVWAAWLARPSGPLGARLARSLPWLAAAVLVQSYHFAEHVAKMHQHLNLGIDPAPGIFGGLAGLVWFHFGINLAVYVGMAIPLAGVALSFRVPRRRAVAPAT